MKKKAIIGLLLVVFGTLWAQGSVAAGGIISPAKAKELFAKDKNAVLLDVRTLEEFEVGHIAKAILLPYDEIKKETAAKSIPTKETTVVVYCRTGRRSAIAATTLRTLGYTTVWDLGGIVSWPYEIEK